MRLPCLGGFVHAVERSGSTGGGSSECALVELECLRRKSNGIWSNDKARLETPCSASCRNEWIENTQESSLSTH